MRKQVAIEEPTAEDLGRVAKKNNVSRDKVISKMLEFFRVYGIDPFNYEAPHEEMTKIIKRFDQMFGFLKKQEKDILKPTLLSLATREQAENLSMEIDKSLFMHEADKKVLEASYQEKYENLKQEFSEQKVLLEGQIKLLQKSNDLLTKQLEKENNIRFAKTAQMFQEIAKAIGVGGQSRKETQSRIKDIFEN